MNATEREFGKQEMGIWLSVIEERLSNTKCQQPKYLSLMLSP
jgi:hypothetical protein